MFENAKNGIFNMFRISVARSFSPRILIVREYSQEVVGLFKKHFVSHYFMLNIEMVNRAVRVHTVTEFASNRMPQNRNPKNCLTNYSHPKKYRIGIYFL